MKITKILSIAKTEKETSIHYLNDVGQTGIITLNDKEIERVIKEISPTHN